MLTLFE